ncbi:MAG TPA: hypothetical protein VK186_16485 [Candidatus Deferrimicrobium sp.]|nr:hypothetical protein [Candidatus Deferrimicrobium sp.]
MQLKFDPKPFLRSSDLPWIRYKLQKEQGGDTQALKKALAADSRVKRLLEECRQWPGPPMKRHNEAGHILHKICLLIDFGLGKEDEGMPAIAETILKYQADNGAFLTNLLIPKHFGGPGVPSMQWILSDFPTVLYILLALGYAENPQVLKAIELLKSLIADNGWGCAGSIPKFRGPGKKSDHCPYATLISLQALALLPAYREEKFIKIGCDALLNQWQERKTKRYYMFAMGTDFRKLKYPNLWFEITHVCKVLSHFPYARETKSFREMMQIIIEKQQESGGFIPESVYTEYKGWDFGQKKEPSPSLTYAIREIFKNLNDR